MNIPLLISQRKPEHLHDMYHKCLLATYEDIRRWYIRRRDHGKNVRPFGGWAKIVQGDDRTFTVLIHNIPLCTITPDNKLTMLVSGNEAAKISNTVSMSIHRLVPISWLRAGMRRYRVLSLGAMGKDDNWWISSRQAPELFNGLQFDLLTGMPVNAKPDIITRVDTDTRRIWLRALRKFKHGIKVRAKMGVFDAVQDELSNAKHSTPRYRAVNGAIFSNRAPDWTNEQWINLLHTSIRDEQYPKELLAGFLLSAPNLLWGRTHIGTNADRMNIVATKIINANSIELRSRFGVFTDDTNEVTDEKQD